MNEKMEKRAMKKFPVKTGLSVRNRRNTQLTIGIQQTALYERNVEEIDCKLLST